MEESKDLKTGDTVSYEIDGQTIVLKPVTLGKMKRAMSAFEKKDADTFSMMREHLCAILDNGANPFVTAEWIDDKITMPMAVKIINDMRTINGLGPNGFFPQGGPAESPRETRDLTGAAPTPSV